MNDKRLTLVTGAGRSGTSTMAGALHMLGHHLPRPVLHANDSNPKGFFESRWPVRFHRRLLERAVVEQTDGRPVAADLVAKQVDDDVRRELSAWLTTQLEISDDVIVKDPRAAWVPMLWAREAAAPRCHHRVRDHAAASGRGGAQPRDPLRREPAVDGRARLRDDEPRRLGQPQPRAGAAAPATRSGPSCATTTCAPTGAR